MSPKLANHFSWFLWHSCTKLVGIRKTDWKRCPRQFQWVQVPKMRIDFSVDHDSSYKSFQGTIRKLKWWFWNIVNLGKEIWAIRLTLVASPEQTRKKKLLLRKLFLILSRVIFTINATVWKFHDFSITQILSEINFRDSGSAKSAILTLSGALNFCISKTEIYPINKIQSH